MADGPFFLPFSPVSCMLVMVPSVDKEVRAMTLLQMSYILEIDRCGSINRAAKRLYVSQSSLSRGIKELEAETGIQIFSRSSTGGSFSKIA